MSKELEIFEIDMRSGCFIGRDWVRREGVVFAFDCVGMDAFDGSETAVGRERRLTIGIAADFLAPVMRFIFK